MTRLLAAPPTTAEDDAAVVAEDERLQDVLLDAEAALIDRADDDANVLADTYPDHDSDDHLQMPTDAQMEVRFAAQTAMYLAAVAFAEAYEADQTGCDCGRCGQEYRFDNGYAPARASLSPTLWFSAENGRIAMIPMQNDGPVGAVEIFRALAGLTSDDVVTVTPLSGYVPTTYLGRLLTADEAELARADATDMLPDGACTDPGHDHAHAN